MQIRSATIAPLPAASAPVPAPGDVAGTPPVPVASAGERTDQMTSWTNPAAAAALRSSVSLLKVVEDGITRNYGNADRIVALASDLRSVFGILDQATNAIARDGSADNDAFLPLIQLAGSDVSAAQEVINGKDFAVSWPIFRGDVLAAVRRAGFLSQNVADQVDPRSVFTAKP